MGPPWARDGTLLRAPQRGDQAGQGRRTEGGARPASSRTLIQVAGRKVADHCASRGADDIVESAEPADVVLASAASISPATAAPDSPAEQRPEDRQRRSSRRSDGVASGYSAPPRTLEAREHGPGSTRCSMFSWSSEQDARRAGDSRRQIATPRAERQPGQVPCLRCRAAPWRRRPGLEPVQDAEDVEQHQEAAAEDDHARGRATSRRGRREPSRRRTGRPLRTGRRKSSVWAGQDAHKGEHRQPERPAQRRAISAGRDHHPRMVRLLSRRRDDGGRDGRESRPDRRREESGSPGLACGRPGADG